MKAATSRRMAIFTPTFYGHDGISSVARGMAAALSQLASGADELDVLSLCDERRPLRNDSAKDAQYLCAEGSKIRFVATSLKQALTRRYGLVLVNHLSLLPLAMMLRSPAGRVAAFLHGVECWRPIGRLRSWSLRKSDLRLANSQHTWNELVQHNQCLTGLPVSICPLGVSDTVGSSSHKARPADYPDLYALIVGRMASDERYKGHDQLIDVWPRVLEQVPQATLMIAGTGDDLARLQRRVQDAGLQTKIRFLGRVDDPSLDHLYRHAAFFAMPSTGEGFGLVFLEAMRNRLACVGGIGAASEVIVDGETGFVVDPKNQSDLLATLINLFLSPTRCQQMGDAGRRRFETHFTESHFSKRLQDALSLCNSFDLG